jgi:hypothetical protein
MAEDFLKRPLERVSAFDGMKLDANIWNQAHDFHLHQQRLHGLGFHGGGIVCGLEVYAKSPPDRSVRISPGLAVDQNGSVIVVPEIQEYTFTSKRKGTIYLVVQLREIPAREAATTGDEETRPTRLRQAFRIQESEALPGELDVELARMDLDDPKAKITDTRDHFSPGANELDLRFRRFAGTHTRGQIHIGQLVTKEQGEAIHTEGLLHLIEHINAATPYRAHFMGQLAPGDTSDGCNILYLAGDKNFKLAADAAKTLAEFIENGGFLFGDGCRQTVKDQFGLAFDQLATQLKRKPSQIAKGHAVLRTHYVFAEPPGGTVDSGPVMMGNGLVYCGRDYGCAWSGGGGGKNLSREIIRAALEFGTNIAVFGLRRWYKAQLAQS